MQVQILLSVNRFRRKWGGNDKAPVLNNDVHVFGGKFQTERILSRQAMQKSSMLLEVSGQSSQP